MTSLWPITWRLEGYPGELFVFLWSLFLVHVFLHLWSTVQNLTRALQVQPNRLWRALWKVLMADDEFLFSKKTISSAPALLLPHWLVRVIYLPSTLCGLHERTWCFLSACCNWSALSCPVCPVCPLQPSSHLFGDAGTFERGLQSGGGRRTEPRLVSERAWNWHVPCH